jgi:hypothetical protein
VGPVLRSDDITADPEHPRTVESLEKELAEMVEALRSRSVIEQAKGMVMLRYGLDEDIAFRVLVRWSSIYNVKLRTVAATLVHAGTRTVGPEPGVLSDDPGLRAAVVETVVGTWTAAEAPAPSPSRPVAGR